MKKIVIVALATACFATTAIAQPQATPDDMATYRAQMKAASEQMKDPAIKKQMQEMARQRAAEPGPQNADGIPEFSEKSMKAALGMHKCMSETAGKQGMENMGIQSKQNDERVRALCKEGKRDEADRVQKQFADDIMKSNEFKAMQECAEKHKELMHDPAYNTMQKRMAEQKHQARQHVCD